MKPKTVSVEYIESGSFQGSEEQAFLAGIKRGQDCVVMSEDDFKSRGKAFKDAGTNLGIAIGTLLFVIQGLRSKSITAKPIIDTSNMNVESLPIVSLEEHIWKALKQCGVTEKKSPKTKAVKAR